MSPSETRTGQTRTGQTPRLREIAPGILVATSELFMTTTTVAVAGDGGCLVIDPAVTVAELAGLAAELSAAGLRPQAGFATHPHWDHVLWCRDLGDVPRYAAGRAVPVAEQGRDAMILEAAASAPGHDLELFGHLVPLPGAAESIPWPGPAAQVITHDGHAPGHSAVFFPDSGVLVAGDMCSDVEIPLLDLAAADPVGDYRTGLGRLAAVPGVRWLVPGHGRITDAVGLRGRLDADAGYLDQLELGAPFDDARITQAWLREQHDLQLQLGMRSAG
jgi:hydroxyacylglutathione hydrolase